MVEQLSELSAEERRDDGRRCLVATQAMCIGGRHDRGLQQTVVFENSHQRLDDEGHEAQVFLRGLAWSVEQYAIIGRERPVVMLTRAIDAIEGLFMQQHAETVVASHLLHQRHEQHVMVDGQVALLEDGGQLKLVGCYLVVACLDRDGQLEGLNLKILHESLNAIGDGAKIVVVHSHDPSACDLS